MLEIPQLYRDPFHQATTNLRFYNKLHKHLENMDRISSSRDPNKKEALQAEVIAVLRLCDYNPGFLLPWFFPKAINNGPLSLLKRPFAFSMLGLLGTGFMAFLTARQVAKSTSLGARQLVNKDLLHGWKSMYIAPHPTQAKTYANRMSELERNFRYYQKRGDIRQNLFFKETPYGSTVTIENVLTTVMHIHGQTADEILFDEYQHFDSDFEDEIVAIQASRVLRSKIYAGTASTQDSPLQGRYEEGTAAAWHIKAGDGKTELNCYDKETMIKMVQPGGPTCPITGKILDVTDGRWVFANRGSALEANKYSFHVPRIIIPDYAYNLVRWNEIYELFKNNVKNGLRVAGGIPVDEGYRELSKEELQAICVLGDQRKLWADVMKQQKYRWIVSGSDWGGSEYAHEFRTKKSFSCHFMFGVTTTGEVHILHMKRYSGQQYEEVAYNMCRNHHTLKGFAWGSDAGVGSYYNALLRQRINEHRHLILNLVGPNTPPLSPIAHGALYNMFNCNKTEALSALFHAIKAKKILCYSWEQAASGLMDFLNSMRVVSENATGRKFFRYIKRANVSDDMMMAAGFGYVVVRMLMGEPLIPDPAVANVVKTRMQDGSFVTLPQSSVGIFQDEADYRAELDGGHYGASPFTFSG